jgi:hypothetical protein
MPWLQPIFFLLAEPQEIIKSDPANSVIDMLIKKAIEIFHSR